MWGWDFIHDRDAAGRPRKGFAWVDEYPRECLALEVERSRTGADVMDILAPVFLIRGVPRFIRSDNGPEFIAPAIRRYLATAGVGTLYMAPASPWENGFAESFFSRRRDERLNAELFGDLRAAKVLAAAWQSEYHHRRPHSALGYPAPAAFAARGIGGKEILGALPPDPRQGLCPWTPASSPRRAPEDWPGKVENLGQTLITVGT